MHSMQRQFDRVLRKAPGDNAKVAVILSDYEDADRVLAKIIDAAKSWRDAWINIAATQLGVVTEFDCLWDPIVGASDGLGKPPAPTPELQLAQALQLKEAYAELKTELLGELGLIEARVVKPATDARDYISPIRKTIKKRENMRLDYEKVQDKATKLQRKPGKTPKEDAVLQKLEADVARTAEEFHIADAHIRQTLPPIVAAIFSLIPSLVESVLLIQNRLLGLYYTSLHAYCQEHGFPSPPPPMEDVVALWSAGYEPVKREFESITCIATGRAVRLPIDDPSLQDRRTSDSSQSNLANPPRRTTSGLIPSKPTIGPRPNRIPSSTSLTSQPSPALEQRPSAGNNYITSNLTPTDFTTASRLGHGQLATPSTLSPNSLRPRTDYFARPPSAVSTAGSTTSINTASSFVSAAAAKKKPPPPPPPKKIASTRLEQYVVAQYPFKGEGEGDLSFREGDRIKIIKKTDTLDDWWVGELGGIRGSFPANYCK
ncbi:hypothetical protein F5Y18DRAFT_126353 [Xylariaceae sp. FL1019]|nr:hypothetical protein F5Y18DRAFT_126353 [Xylariaceae sp. FL1019]